MGLDSDLTIQSFETGFTGRDQHEVDESLHDEKRANSAAKTNARRERKRQAAGFDVTNTLERLTQRDLPTDPRQALAELLACRKTLDSAIRILGVENEHYVYTKDLRLREAATEAIRIIDATVPTLNEQIRLDVQRDSDIKRQARMSSRPDTSVTQIPARMCIACNRKAARIDDYCKKCARAHGIIVHGKIGSA